ncbi:DUF3572 domain-containing protein [Afifella sp. IM 167]|uniref:DUF3572 domain-containing protein n=1 Tax=Afifella sp. IM 167 TaxID=2033586 RepID=UPI001CC9D517|nr:DUF3572 domain-containing protein [Afifella sp. IM 167]MBZ8132461.1 hypothetical protein [Afifella sp. IM 167]
MIQAKGVSREKAEDIAVSALAYIGSSEKLCARYLQLTGLTVQSLRRAAGEPGFLAATLAFLTAHEPDLMDFAAASGLKPQEIARAAEVLERGQDDSGPAPRP